MKVKFTFYLKSGKVFECVEELTSKQFKNIVETIKTAFTEGFEGSVTFSGCMVRLSECAVADWEVFDE